MLNKIFSLFHIGDSTQTNQVNHIYNAKIDTSVKRLEQDFHEGNIQQSMEDLESLLNENKSNIEIKYQLHIKKASFLISLRRYEEALELLDYIEKEYVRFLDTSFDELKLISFSTNKDAESFFQLVKKIKMEDSKTPDIESFQSMYYLNTGEIEIAKEIFENLSDELKIKQSISFMGGHIYSSLNDYEKANKFYQIALSFDISFLDKAMIYGFYGTDILNKLRNGELVLKNDKELIFKYQKIIEQVLNQSKFFDNLYIESLKNIFLHIFVVLDDLEKYIDFYEQETTDIFIKTSHYFQYLKLKKLPIEHEKIQEIILRNNEEVLIFYVLSLENEDNDSALKIINFLESNSNFIYENQFILLSYIRWKVNNNSDINKEIINYLESNKYKNFEYLTSFVLFKESLSIEDMEKLLEFAYDENNIYARILETITILKDFRKSKEYLNLALNKENKFEYIISDILKICEQDKNLRMDDFSDFVNTINSKSSYYIYIANVYIKYGNYKVSFDFLYKEFEQNNENDSLLFGILDISIKHFVKTKEVFEKNKQLEVYTQLINKKGNLSIHEIVFLFEYSMIILKETKQILPFLNQYLLNTDIQTLDKEIKIGFSNLFTQTSFGIANYDTLFLYDDNICLVKDGQTYIKNSYTILETNISKIGCSLLDENKFFLMEQDNEAIKESLFHQIIGVFALSIKNPNHTKILVNTKSENPLSELFPFLEEKKQKTIELFTKYSNKEYFGLFVLSGKDYINYFTFIPYLLNHKKYYFNSLPLNLIIDKKKILTLSSIVFLNEIGYLDEVLKRDDIVIQQTLINWLKIYIEKFNYSARPREYNYLDNSEPVFVPRSAEEEQEAEDFKNFIILLTTKLLKCEIIDDTSSNLPINEAYEVLSDIGSQEYHALVYYLDNNYQIISENNIFEMIFTHLGYNKNFLGNSLGLLENQLDNKVMYKLRKKLYLNKYRHIYNCIDEKLLIEILYLSKLNLNEQEILLFRILYADGCLDSIILKYINKYKVLYPKMRLPKEDVFSKNMEYLQTILKDFTLAKANPVACSMNK